MSLTRKNNYKAKIANELYEAVRMFENGQASPESLYVINAGVCTVFRELIESGAVHPHDPAVDMFLDLYQNEMIESRTLVYNKRKGLI